MATSNQVREIFESLRRPLVGFFLHLGCGFDEAEDLTQQTMLRVLTTEAKYRGEGSLEAWVRQIARNLFLDHVRRRSTLGRRGIDVPLDQMEKLTDQQRQAPSGPMQRILTIEVREQLEHEIGKLPAQQRRCILLRSQDLSYEEIGEVLGIGVETTRTHLRLARERLRKVTRGLLG